MRTALFPLVLLAIVISGILPTHQAVADFTGTDTASAHATHHTGGTSALGPGESDPHPSADHAGGDDPIPVCHPADAPMSGSPDRCTSRNHDEGKPAPVGYDFPTAGCADPALQHRSPETRPWWHPHGPRLLSLLCVLRT